MKISQEDEIWFNISICQSGMVHEGRWVNFLTMVGKLEASTVSQVNKPKMHRSASEISHETSILCSSVHTIIHRDLQFKCFKRRCAQLLSEANRISRLTRW